MQKKSKAIHLLTLLAFALGSLPGTAVLGKPGKAQTDRPGGGGAGRAAWQWWQHPGTDGDSVTGSQGLTDLAWDQCGAARTDVCPGFTLVCLPGIGSLSAILQGALQGR